MKNICTPFLLFVSIVLNAQSAAWDLFPLNQRSWWRADNTLQTFYCDSTDQTGNVRTHYFGARYIPEPFGDCFEPIFISNPDKTDQVPEQFFAPWESTGNTCKLAGADQPQFFTQTQIGDKWSFPVNDASNGFDAVRLEHIADDTLDLWGLKTAAQHFRLQPLLNGQPVSNALTGAEIILTEKAGMLRFIPFHLLLKGQIPPVYELKGFQANGQDYGLVPSFGMFLGKYKAGDLYKWQEIHDTYIPAGQSIVFSQHLDSLTSVQYTPEQIILTSFRRTLSVSTLKGFNGSLISVDSSSTVVPAFVRKLAREKLEAQIETVPGWYNNYRGGTFTNIIFSQSQFDTANVLSLRGSPDFGFDSTHCGLGQTIDLSELTYLNNRCGYMGYSLGILNGSSSEFLIGCRMGTEVWGDITQPPTVSVFEPLQVAALSIMPTLTTGPIRIVQPPLGSGFHGDLILEVCNVAGQLSYVETNFTFDHIPDLSALPAGVYLVTVRSHRSLAVGKVALAR